MRARRRRLARLARVLARRSHFALGTPRRARTREARARDADDEMENPGMGLKAPSVPESPRGQQLAYILRTAPEMFESAVDAQLAARG